MKFFISYSRSVKEDVRAVIELLRKSGHEVWWDADIPMMDDWWATILKNIEWCEIFIFMISEKSVSSEYCMAELLYGIARNRPVLPLILDDHTHYTIPSELGRRQWFIHNGDAEEMQAQIFHDIKNRDLSKYTDMYAPRPPEPASETGTLAKQYQQAVSLAENGHFEEASKRFRNVASLDFDEWGVDCRQWIERLQRYADIADLADHKATLERAKTKWNDYLKQYNAEFDPLSVKAKVSQVADKIKPAKVIMPSKPKINTILPPPFEWIEIPAVEIMVMQNNDKKQMVSSPAFAIAKYPVTNAQFAKFIDAKGYENKVWWTHVGWQQKTNDGWTQPRYWQNNRWNNDLQPVIGISWYEAVAFCLWLSDISCEKVTLPTEQQWQRAAQGDDSRVYPWGDDWGSSRCRNGVDSSWGGIERTSFVNKYQGRGDSPFGVVDMAGNVWEMCRTKYETGQQDLDGTEARVLRGGSWYSYFTTDFQCNSRLSFNPSTWSDLYGFRIASS